MGWMIRGIDENISFRFFLVDSTDVVKEAASYHKTTPVASAALGRVLTAGLMMGYTMKNERDKLTVRINGGGPIGNIIVTADASGHIKGYCDNPHLPVEIKKVTVIIHNGLMK